MNPPSVPPPEVLDRAWLKARIEADVPELSDPDLSDFAKVCALRRWVRNQLLVADEQTVLYRWDINPWERSPNEIIWWSEQRQAGVFCDGFAFVTQRVFELCGYRAATYAMGDESTGASHVVTLVEIQHRGAPMVVIQDAYFNFTVLTNSGEPAEIVSFLNGLRNDGPTDFRFEVSTESAGLLYGGDKDVSGIMAHYGLPHEPARRLGEVQEVHAAWNLHQFVAGEPSYLSLLRQNHNSADPMNLFLHPHALSDNALGHELSSFIECRDRTPA